MILKQLNLMGINVDNTISATFAIGSALAGAAGVIFGIYYTKIDPLMGIIPGIKAFVAAVLGGIGIIPGAMVGGLVLGVVETFVSASRVLFMERCCGICHFNLNFNFQTVWNLR